MNALQLCLRDSGCFWLEAVHELPEGRHLETSQAMQNIEKQQYQNRVSANSPNDDFKCESATRIFFFTSAWHWLECDLNRRHHASEECEKKSQAAPAEEVKS